MAQGDVTCDLTNALPKRCAVFDGVDDYVELGNPELFLPNINSWTISGWFNADTIESSSNAHRIIQVEKSASSTAVALQCGWDNKATFQYRDVDGIAHTISIKTISKGKWYYFTATYNGTDYNVYIDSVLENTITDTITLIATGGKAYIGRYGGGYFFSGGIKNARFYNKALSQEEVTKLYNGFNVTDGLVHQYKLDKDYVDSVGGADGTNNGSYLTTVDDQVATAVKNARVTANDKYLISVVNDKVMTAVIEEV